MMNQLEIVAKTEILMRRAIKLISKKKGFIN